MLRFLEDEYSKINIKYIEIEEKSIDGTFNIVFALLQYLIDETIEANLRKESL